MITVNLTKSRAFILQTDAWMPVPPSNTAAELRADGNAHQLVGWEAGLFASRNTTLLSLVMYLSVYSGKDGTFGVVSAYIC